MTSLLRPHAYIGQALQLSQKAQAHSLHKEQEAKKAAADKQWKEEVDAMNARQAAEYQKHVETITKAAALEDVELPRRLVKYRCGSMNTSVALYLRTSTDCPLIFGSGRRYRPSPPLQAFRATLKSLRANGGMSEMIEAVQAKADNLEDDEVAFSSHLFPNWF